MLYVVSWSKPHWWTWHMTGYRLLRKRFGDLDKQVTTDKQKQNLTWIYTHQRGEALMAKVLHVNLELFRWFFF